MAEATPLDKGPPFRQGELDTLRTALADLIAPNESCFIVTGNALALARDKLGDGSRLFRHLSGNLDHGEGGRSIDAFAEARDTLLRIADEAEGIAEKMTRFRQHILQVRRPLQALETIIGEISALATNAKIQAAQVNAHGVDFSVFTTDIDRLRVMAGTAIRRAVERLSKLETSMEAAHQAADGFRRGDAKELVNIAARMATWLLELRHRREQAKRALVELERHSQRMGLRVADCVGKLQINDMTTQRIEHVRSALDILHDLLMPGTTPLVGSEWLAELAEERKEQIVGAVCELQARQVDRAVGDFSRAVGDLRRNLAGLAQDARHLNAEAQKVFGVDDTAGSFMQMVYADVDRAALLLERFSQTNEAVRGQITDMADSFAEMTDDLRTIQSIDADMRVMGLNATFKCSRLGASGLVLGVVAQELRACSRRTDETTRAIAAAIATANTEAVELAERSSREHVGVAGIAAYMGQASRTTQELDRSMTADLAELAVICDEVSRQLGAGGILNIDGTAQQAGKEQIVRLLRQLGAGIASAVVDPLQIRDDVERMLGQHYTMQSERMVHELFASDDGTAAAAQQGNCQSSAAASSEIDDFFF